MAWGLVSLTLLRGEKHFGRSVPMGGERRYPQRRFSQNRRTALDDLHLGTSEVVMERGRRKDNSWLHYTLH